MRNAREVLSSPSGRLTRRVLLKRAAVLGIAVPSFASLLAACGGGSSSASTATSSNNSSNSSAAQTASTPVPNATIGAGGTPSASSSSGGTPKNGGTMTWVAHQDIAGLGPSDVGDSDQWDIITQMHNALIEMDENFVFNPTLAEKFETAADGKSYTFHLRNGVKFHDGTDFSSADVKYTFDFYSKASNGSLIASAFTGYSSTDTPDDMTAVVKMSDVNASFLINGATTFIVQSKYHAQVGEKTYRTKPIGTGPYKLKEWNQADHTTVTAFDGHFRGRPHIDTIILKVVPEPSVRAIALQTGSADSAVWPLLTTDEIKLSQQTDKFTTFTSLSTALNMFPINNERPYFADKNVRQALMYAIDRQKVIDTVFHGAAVLATGNIAPNVKTWYNPNVQKYSYDPNKAKQMLDAAGWKVGSDGTRAKNGQKFSFTCIVENGDQVREPEAELVQQFLKAVGIDMKITHQPVSVMNQLVTAGKADCALYNWTFGTIDPDASDSLGSTGSNNGSHYKNPEVDKLLAEGLKTVDQAKRKQIYDQIQVIFAQDVPNIYMMYWKWFNHFTKRIKGLPKSALTGGQLYNKAYQWWIEG